MLIGDEEPINTRPKRILRISGFSKISKTAAIKELEAKRQSLL